MRDLICMCIYRCHLLKTRQGTNLYVDLPNASSTSSPGPTYLSDVYGSTTHKSLLIWSLIPLGYNGTARLLRQIGDLEPKHFPVLTKLAAKSVCLQITQWVQF